MLFVTEGARRAVNKEAEEADKDSFWSRGQADLEADPVPFIIIDKTTNASETWRYLLPHLNISATLMKKRERWGNVLTEASFV